MPTTAPKYSLARGRNRSRCGKNATAKLSRSDVVAMREWVCAEGAGLSIAQQASYLAGMYGVSHNTAAQVVTNLAWYDSDFDRTRPVVVAGNPRWLLHCPQWVLALVLLCQTYRR